MGRQQFKPGNMLYPLPAVLVSTADKEGNSNLLTIAWTGTICSDPPMVSISVRPERFSYHMIEETGEFVINLTTEELCFATDYCGVKSGRDIDKWKETGLTKIAGEKVSVPMVKESPLNLECQVTEKKELGSHHMFLAEVVAVHADEKYMDAQGRFHLNDAGLLVYSHGRYLSTGRELGSFGYSVKRRKSGKNNKKNKR
ncbi:MAG: flavin reductase family protein [Roseburia sp.]|nr:flavin reductase family protein [Ruminococcus sp.]MCM1154739.1 flavin reductase family protein [Roseburia sp.]MCM1243507.1 flavin reductase family protein [Roseburia sp.]